MISMMDTINMEHDRVHRTYSHKPKRTKSALPKRLWSLQSIAGAQQWRKIGPHPTDSEETQQNKKAAASKMEVGGDALTHHYDMTGAENDSGSISNSMDEEDNDQEYKRGLRRKTAKGLKRIITHFSLTDANSLSETPGLTSTALHQNQQIGMAANTTATDEHNYYHPLLLSGETSLDTLSTVPDIMQEMQAEFEISSIEEKKMGTPPASSSRAMRHHYRSQSNPTAVMAISSSEAAAVIPDKALLVDRSLPPLPTDEWQQSKRAITNQVQVEQKFRQAVHWLRKPFHRFLSSPMVATMTSSSPNPSISPLKIHAEPVMLAMSSASLTADARTAAMLLSNHDSNEVHHQGSPLTIQNDQDDLPWVQNSSRANGKMHDLQLRFNRKKVLRCRVVQITNIASSKECQYELFLQMNDITQSSQMGTMKKISKGISAASPKETFSFEVDSPFTLAFILCAKPVSGGLSKMKTLISKMDLASTHRHPEPTDEEEDDQPTPSTSALPIVGSTHLLSGNRFEAFSGKGLSRFTLTRPLMSAGKNQEELQEMDLELMVAFQLEDAVSPTHTYMSGLWTGELDFDAALASCHQGDYLTFYVRGKQFPTWTRYWITLEHGQVYFRHLSYEHKESVDSIPLSELESVCKPWEDIQEQVYFGRKHGIVLKFKKDHVRLDQVHLEEGERLDGYMYLFADSPKKAALWRTVLSAYATADYVTPNASINARYLW